MTQTHNKRKDNRVQYRCTTQMRLVCVVQEAPKRTTRFYGYAPGLHRVSIFRQSACITHTSSLVKSYMVLLINQSLTPHIFEAAKVLQSQRYSGVKNLMVPHTYSAPFNACCWSFNGWRSACLCGAVECRGEGEWQGDQSRWIRRHDQWSLSRGSSTLPL
jgi:hypothetical protein